MSSIYRKTFYIEEGAYGSEEKRVLYMWQYNTCDICHIYDEDFNLILCFGDTTRRPMHVALKELWSCTEPAEDNNIEFLTEEDFENLEKARK